MSRMCSNDHGYHHFVLNIVMERQKGGGKGIEIRIEISCESVSED
jgi:hypothetical protein